MSSVPEPLRLPLAAVVTASVGVILYLALWRGEWHRGPRRLHYARRVKTFGPAVKCHGINLSDVTDAHKDHMNRQLAAELEAAGVPAPLVSLRMAQGCVLMVPGVAFVGDEQDEDTGRGAARREAEAASQAVSAAAASPAPGTGTNLDSLHLLNLLPPDLRDKVAGFQQSSWSLEQLGSGRMSSIPAAASLDPGAALSFRVTLHSSFLTEVDRGHLRLLIWSQVEQQQVKPLSERWDGHGPDARCLVELASPVRPAAFLLGAGVLGPDGHIAQVLPWQCAVPVLPHLAALEAATYDELCWDLAHIVGYAAALKERAAGTGAAQGLLQLGGAGGAAPLPPIGPAASVPGSAPMPRPQQPNGDGWLRVAQDMRRFASEARLTHVTAFLDRHVIWEIRKSRKQGRRRGGGWRESSLQPMHPLYLEFADLTAEDLFIARFLKASSWVNVLGLALAAAAARAALGGQFPAAWGAAALYVLVAAAAAVSGVPGKDAPAYSRLITMLLLLAAALPGAPAALYSCPSGASRPSPPTAPTPSSPDPTDPFAADMGWAFLLTLLYAAGGINTFPAMCVQLAGWLVVSWIATWLRGGCGSDDAGARTGAELAAAAIALGLAYRRERRMREAFLASARTSAAASREASEAGGPDPRDVAGSTPEGGDRGKKTD